MFGRRILLGYRHDSHRRSQSPTHRGSGPTPHPRRGVRGDLHLLAACRSIRQRRGELTAMALLSSLDSHENTPRHSAAPLDWQDFSRMYHLHLVIAGLSLRIRVRLGEERWLPLCIQALLLTPLQLLD